MADWVLRQPGTVLSLPVAAIAREAGVSQPTVIRFCRSMGCHGLSDFKLRLAQGNLGNVAHDGARGAAPERAAPPPGTRVLQNTIDALAALQDRLDPHALEAAVALVDAAHRIDLYGFGSSGVVAAEPRGYDTFFPGGARPSAEVVEFVNEAARKRGAREFDLRATVFPVDLPALDSFKSLLEGSGDREISTTMGFVRMLTALLKDMQASTAAGGLIARAANRHLGKSDREAAGVLYFIERAWRGEAASLCAERVRHPGRHRHAP